MDKIKVTILENGNLKLETDTVSEANHTNAENLLKEIERLSGGLKEVVVKKRSLWGRVVDKIKGHQHVHHGHGHSHGGGWHTH